jgi:hypothetical protein
VNKINHNAIKEMNLIIQIMIEALSAFQIGIAYINKKIDPDISVLIKIGKISKFIFFNINKIINDIINVPIIDK